MRHCIIWLSQGLRLNKNIYTFRFLNERYTTQNTYLHSKVYDYFTQWQCWKCIDGLYCANILFIFKCQVEKFKEITQINNLKIFIFFFVNLKWQIEVYSQHCTIKGCPDPYGTNCVVYTLTHTEFNIKQSNLSGSKDVFIYIGIGELLD